MKVKEYLKQNLNSKDIDFTKLYEKGDKVYYIRVLENLGIKEFKELKLRTIYADLMVGVDETSRQTSCIFLTTAPLVFKNRREALEVYNMISVPKVNFTENREE